MITYNPELFVRNVKGGQSGTGLVRVPNCQLGNLPQLPEASGLGNLTITGLATGRQRRQRKRGKTQNTRRILKELKNCGGRRRI